MSDDKDDFETEWKRKETEKQHLSSAQDERCHTLPSAIAPDGTLAEDYIGVAVGMLNKGVIDMGKVIDWNYDNKGKIVWGLEYDTSVIYVPFDELLHAQKVAALLPKAMLLASETVRVLVHTQARG